jgi:competence protein ComEC
MKPFKYLIALVLIIVVAVAGYQVIPWNPPSRNLALPLLQITYLDVGQADSALIQSGNSYMLIDAGGNSTAKSLVSTLKDMGITKFDVVVGTHPHEDHIGGLDKVIDQFDIGEVYMPDATNSTVTFEDVLSSIENKGLSITVPEAGSSFNLGSAACSILAPVSPDYSDLNNYSIVIRVSYGSRTFLFTGDAQEESEKEMLGKGYPLKAYVLKVAHHGSSTSTSDAFLQAVSPEYAVISVGQDNDYGHPHQETLDKLNTGGIKFYRTDLNGDITFTSDGANLSVSTEK